MGEEGVEFEGSADELLASLEKLTREELSCILVYEGREIGAVIPMADYAFLCQAAEREARAEAKQDSYYDDGEHRPEPWVSWSEQKQRLAAEAAGAIDGTEDQGE